MGGRLGEGVWRGKGARQETNKDTITRRGRLQIRSRRVWRRRVGVGKKIKEMGGGGGTEKGVHRREIKRRSKLHFREPVWPSGKALGG